MLDMAPKRVQPDKAATAVDPEATVTIPLSMLTDNRRPRIIQIGDGQLLLLSAQPINLGTDGVLSTTESEELGDGGNFTIANVVGDVSAQYMLGSNRDRSLSGSTILHDAVSSSDDFTLDMPSQDSNSSSRSRTRKSKPEKKCVAAAVDETAPDAELEEEPLYVNAKQFERILARRRARARLEARGIYVKERPKYLHESRHKHATNRKRGPGGQFDNLAKTDGSVADGN